MAEFDIDNKVIFELKQGLYAFDKNDISYIMSKKSEDGYIGVTIYLKNRQSEHMRIKGSDELIKLYSLLGFGSVVVSIYDNTEHQFTKNI